MTPQELEAIIHQILSNELRTTFALAAVLMVVLPPFAAALGSYMATKGKNLATKEDLAHLEKQVAATTKVAEEIKADVGKASKQWELKRQIYTDLLEALYRLLFVEENLIEAERREDRVYALPDEDQAEPLKVIKALRNSLTHEEHSHLRTVVRIRGIGALMLAKETTSALDVFDRSWTKAHDEDSSLGYLLAKHKAAATAYEITVATGKRELGLQGET
jgi:hypothetical protein